MNLLRRLWSRRRTSVSVEGDRRRPTLQEAKELVDHALDDLERTIIGKKAISANDVQRHVQFDTFAEICEFRYTNGSMNAHCKHKDHEAAGTGVAICAEVVCPFCRHRK